MVWCIWTYGYTCLVIFRNVKVGRGAVVKNSIVMQNTVLGENSFLNCIIADKNVVIKDGRIVAARCVVPMKNDRIVTENVGTRHRAAIGMSESSDAIVVVVSEETGIISIADKGIMKRDISAGELREILTKAFVKNNDKDGSRIKNFFRGK